MMKKTSVYLTEREVARLERLSRDLGRPKAELIREAIATYDPEPPDRNFRLAGAGEGPGDSIADYTEEELLEGFGES
jgi:predicted transcriptional regulator